jgi:hypothetical protein
MLLPFLAVTPIVLNGDTHCKSVPTVSLSFFFFMLTPTFELNVTCCLESRVSF